jgi:hypothetical protein
LTAGILHFLFNQTSSGPGGNKRKNNAITAFKRTCHQVKADWHRKRRRDRCNECFEKTGSLVG